MSDSAERLFGCLAFSGCLSAILGAFGFVALIFAVAWKVLTL